jgi:hypothetical protein
VAKLPLPLVKICDFGYSKSENKSAAKSKVGCTLTTHQCSSSSSSRQQQAKCNQEQLQVFHTAARHPTSALLSRLLLVEEICTARSLSIHQWHQWHQSTSRKLRYDCYEQLSGAD